MFISAAHYSAVEAYLYIHQAPWAEVWKFVKRAPCAILCQAGCSAQRWSSSFIEVASRCKKAKVFNLVFNAALPKMLNLDADVPSWSVFDYCARYERLLDTRRIARMFSDRRRKAKNYRLDVRHVTDLNMRKQCCVSMRQWCVGKTSPAVPFDMLSTRQGDEVWNACRLYSLLWRYCGRWTKEERFNLILL